MGHHELDFHESAAGPCCKLKERNLAKKIQLFIDGLSQAYLIQVGGVAKKYLKNLFHR